MHVNVYILTSDTLVEFKVYVNVYILTSDTLVEFLGAQEARRRAPCAAADTPVTLRLDASQRAQVGAVHILGTVCLCCRCNTQQCPVLIYIFGRWAFKHTQI